MYLYPREKSFHCFKVVSHTCDLSTKLRQEDDSEFEASLNFLEYFIVHVRI